ncbi:hypothetical protein C8Q76DRAFT_792823 [Earliella scabrosa]|nr:hypothetical protein C8Q76DRAFT_792823 [Earliella scabrosa]
MAPVHSKLCSPNPSPYIFSAVRRRDRERTRPTVVELSAPPPPHSLMGGQLTVTRLFNPQTLSQNKALLRRRETYLSLRPPDATASGSPSSSKRAGTSRVVSSQPGVDKRQGPPSSHFKTEKMIIDDDDQDASSESSLSSLSSSSPPPTFLRAKPGTSQAAPSPILRNAQPGLSSQSLGRPLTRSALRASIPDVPSSAIGTTNKKKKCMADIEARLARHGGIVTRFGERDGNPIFVREHRKTSTTEPDIITWYWQSFTLTPLHQPPDLTSYPKLSFGDIYCNVVKASPQSAQLWVWTKGLDGKGDWERAREGDVREDGRQLTITPKEQEPGWVSALWGLKQLRNPDGRDM